MLEKLDTRPHRANALPRLPAALALLLGIVACSPGEEAVEPLRAPGINVILVTIDTLRADHLGCYGYQRDTTPSLDAVARDGVRFEAAFSTRGLTFPSIASVMTSKYVYSHGVVGMFKNVLPESQETLAETMKRLGYRTVGFTSHLGFARQTGFHQGFDEFQLFHSDDEPKMFDQIGTWLAEKQQQKFFLWLHSFGTHSDYRSPEPWNSKFTRPDYDGPFDGSQKQLYEIAFTQQLSDPDKDHIIGLYDGRLAWVDHQFGRMLAELEKLGLRERTLLIVTADHGEELFDHFHYFSHEASIYDGVLRVPLLMSLPGRFPAGHVVGREAVVELIDILPTILDVLGEAPGKELQGQSLLRLVAGVADRGHEYAYGTIDHRKTLLGIRSPRWRYIYNPEQYNPGLPAPLLYKKEELYELSEDPLEKTNVAGLHPEVTAQLRKEILRWVAWTRESKADLQLVDDPILEARLRALGYVEDEAPRLDLPKPSEP